jgi:hypothetical protein
MYESIDVPISLLKRWSEMVSEEDYLACIDDLFLETIGDVLNQVFGENSAKTILRHVKKSSSLKWEEIPRRIEVFADALQKTLGIGAVIIEDLILETLYPKLGLEFRWKKGYGFWDYIEELRQKCSTITNEITEHKWIEKKGV